MKKINPILLLLLLSTSLWAQDISFDLISNESISVRNNNRFSTRILVFNNNWKVRDVILRPGETSTIPYEYSREAVKKISYKAVYDDRALAIDFDRIESAKAQRDRERAQAGMVKALGALIDETFLGGTFSKLFEIGNYGLMLFNGATEEEWAEALGNTAVGFGIDETFDNNFHKGLAAGAYELAKSMQSKEYKDLQDWLVYFMQKRESRYLKAGMITETAKLPRRRSALYPNFFINASYPINQKFVEDALENGTDVRSIKSERFNDELPFELRVAYRNSSRMGFFAEYGQTNVFKNPNTPEFQYLQQGTAFRFTTYSLGITPAYQHVELGLGAIYLQQENFFIEAANNQLNPTESTNKWAGVLEPRINLNLGKLFSLTGSWKVILFTDQAIKETILDIPYLKVGLGINFRKSSLDFSN